MIWLLLIICLPLCFVLAGMESALLSVSRVRVRHAAEEGDRKAASLSRLLESRDDLLHAVAVSNHISGLIAFACASLLVVNAVGPWGWMINFLAVLPLFLVTVELLPKHLYSQKPFRSLRLCAGMLSFIHRLALPWRKLAKKLKPSALDLLPPESDSKGLDDLIKTVKIHKLLPDTCIQMMDRYARLQKSSVESFMQPLRQLTAIPPELPLAQLAHINNQKQQSWYIVLAENGSLLGWLDTNSLPARPHPDKMVRQFLRPLGHVKKTEMALHCLRHLRKRGEPLTAVHDEKQHVVGIITQQSLIGEMFEKPASS